MKKLLLFSLLGFIAFTGYSQSQRYVLFEEFTNASCGPCASQNPGFQAIMAANTSKCTYITYHWNYPGPNDPMFLVNPGEVLSRIGYYGFNFVPSCVMDGITVTGSSYAGAPANVNQTMINNEYAVTSPFELYVNHHLSPDNDSIYVLVMGKCTQAVSGQLLAHIEVIEKHIHYNTAPGSNGEKDFYNVMRKMLPGSSGTTLAASYQPGDYFFVQESWPLAYITTLNELSVVSFVQNKQSKVVHQAALTNPTPITGPYANDVELSDFVDALPAYCVNTLSPTVKIRNNGSEPLTSVTFHYKVNSGTVNDYQWTGNLGFLESANVQLPAINFGLENDNVLTVYSDQTNAVGDNYTKNDTLKHSFEAAYQSGQVVTVNIKTDNFPGETTWDIVDNSGNTLASGGPYADPQTIYTQNVTVGFGTCYQFNIYDAGGNGICCNATTGYGYFQLKSGNATISTGTKFGSKQSAQFYSPSGVGIPGNTNSLLFAVYPNPVSGLATVSFENNVPETITIKVFDLQGKVVLKKQSTSYETGSHEEIIDFSKLSPGIYNVQLTAGDRIFNEKITVTR